MRALTRWVCLAFWMAGVISAVTSSTAAAGPALRRDLRSYVVFGLRSVSVKNLDVIGACNTGVNCAQPSANSDCGVVTHENPLYGDGSQIVGDVARFTKAGGIISQLFSNRPAGLNNVLINMPPIGSPDPLPILGDADGDGSPSCRVQGGQCVTDSGDLEAACGFPKLFPACDGTRKITVQPGGDCLGATDASPGNGRCDLPPGTYGDLEVQNDAKLTFVGGTYTFCRFGFGKDTETIAETTTIVNVNGDLGINNASSFGPAAGDNCGQITVNAKGAGEFAFGRNATISGFFCAPERNVRLGHSNNLSGRFYGDEITADSNNRAYCCVGDECVEPGPGSVEALRRTLDSYFILTMRKAALKNLRLGTPCNIGVNCGTEKSGSSCGVLAAGSITMLDGSQLVADQTFFRKPGGRVWQSFRNNDSPLDNVELVAPQPNPQPFDTPIIPGTCDAECNPDIPAIKALCGFPDPFPACDAGKPVSAQRGEDCLPYDTTPGNQQCDLPPGTYGSFILQNGGRLNLQAGSYVFCRFRTGQKAKVDATGTTILIPRDGVFRASNGTELAEGCGDLKVLVDGESAEVAFGRGGLVAAKICAPETKISLGHNNVLIGQFVADLVSADLNNLGRCCGVCP